MRTIIRDVDWLGPMLGRKREGRNLLLTWVLGDIVYRKLRFSVRYISAFFVRLLPAFSVILKST